MSGGSLLRSVRQLTEEARRVHLGSPVESEVIELAARLDEPLRVAIAGKVKAGKSTLLNAIVGESLAPTDAGECTRIVTWYRNGIGYGASLVHRDGSTLPARFSRDGGALEVFLDGVDVDDVERIVVDWPSTTLADMTLIDTPGIGSLTADAQARTMRFLSPDDDLRSPADAVVYLMRHLHAADARFLEAFHEDGAARATPVNAIGVLSRADEVGGARSDSLRAAARIAQRYRTDSGVRRLCQTVVPVAGLLAQAGGTLTEVEFRALWRIAQLPVEEADALLVSADRFVSAPTSAGLAEVERAHLIERLGIFGLRLSNALIRAGRGESSRMLADELRRRSGLDDLRRELRTQFAARRDVLKARSTLLALDALVRTHPVPGSEQLAQGIERVLAGAHELDELRLLTDVRAGAIRLDEDEVAEVEQLLGAVGATTAERLGRPVDEPPASLQVAALTAHQRWAARAEHPLSSVEVATAARVLQRSYESVIVQLTPR